VVEGAQAANYGDDLALLVREIFLLMPAAPMRHLVPKELRDRLPG